MVSIMSSGGRWNYQSWRIQDQIENLDLSILKFKAFAKAIAESEHLIDWAECGDTVRRREDGSGAERDLYDLWLKTFDEVFGGSG
jgi:hypothetical protein